jgi:hypothetical protein
MNTYGEVKVQLHSFLTSALNGVEWSTPRPGRFTAGGESWVGPRAVVDALEKRSLAPPGNRNSIPRPSSPQPIPILSELSELQLNI